MIPGNLYRNFDIKMLVTAVIVNDSNMTINPHFKLCSDK